jgi:hypothetical protein
MGPVNRDSAGMRVRAWAAGIASGLFVSAVLCAGIYAVVPYKSRPLALAVCLAISAMAALLARLYWRSDAVRARSGADWFRSAVVSTGFMSLLLLVDAILGIVFGPSRNIFVATTSHIGFVATIALAPVALVPVIYCVRAMFAWLLTPTPPSWPASPVVRKRPNRP